MDKTINNIIGWTLAILIALTAFNLYWFFQPKSVDANFKYFFDSQETIFEQMNLASEKCEKGVYKFDIGTSMIGDDVYIPTFNIQCIRDEGNGQYQ